MQYHFNLNSMFRFNRKQSFIIFRIGLQPLHEITSSGSYRLRIDLEDWEGNQAYAEFSLVHY